ncbi:hypothetical protein UQW22_10075 [Isoptericola halotolerans]|uniref:PIN-like domain-containing protein n=1 Tax=Isoptericola halotolerans TaxID=300560 RepID=UPI00388E4F99
MRHFFVDENLTPELATLLSKVHRQHRFTSAQSAGLRGVDDVELFGDLQHRGFDAIITHDANQLEIPEERDGLRSAGLHWIGVPQGRVVGVDLVACQLSVVTPAIQHIVSNWSKKPTAYVLTGLTDLAQIIAGTTRL